MMLQNTPPLDGVLMPSWVIGLFATILMILLGVIGFLVKYTMSGFKDVVGKLEVALGEVVKAFQEFKDKAPKEFVTHPFFEMARQELKDDIAHGHKRIGEFAARFERDLAEHKLECPVRSRTSSKEI